MTKTSELIVCPTHCGWMSEDEGPELNMDTRTNCRNPYQCPKCGHIGAAVEFGMDLTSDTDRVILTGRVEG